MRALLLSTVSIIAGVFAGQAVAQPSVPPPRMTQAPAVRPAVAMPATRPTPTPAASPNARPINIGQTINGTIGPEDPKLSSDQSSYEVYRVQVPAGRRVTATLSSSAFQPVLGLGQTVDDECENCVIDVGEMSTKAASVSRLMTSAGAVELRVNTMNAGETGAFTLTVNAAVPAPLAAQPITFGQSKTGELSANDATSGDDNVPTDAYALRLAAGQRVQVDLSSSNFDAKLELIGPDGGKLAEDDDSGPGNGARIRYTASRAGTYQIRAMSLAEGGMGAYTLRAGAVPAIVPMPAPRPLTLGTAFNGAITTATPSYERDGEEVRAVRYSFNATAGQVYRITATKANGSELDPKIEVGKLVNGAIADGTVDDDGGGDLNSSLRFRPQSNGVHVVEVTSAGESFGAYSVRVQQAAPDRPPGPPIEMSLGREYPGELADGGPRNAEDILFNGYSIALKSGQAVTIDMIKEEDGNIDPKLEIGRGTVSAFEMLQEDDDGGMELNSRLRFVAPSDGTYIVRATTLGAANVGKYKLSIKETPPPVAPPTPTPISIGQQTNGTLTDTDPLMNDTFFYDRYTLNARAGETYEITVTADTFDVVVGARPASREDDDYQTDDDSGGGTNAKLTYSVRTAGPQTIRVTSVGEEQTGAYTITVVKK